MVEPETPMKGPLDIILGELRRVKMMLMDMILVLNMQQYIV